MVKTSKLERAWAAMVLHSLVTDSKSRLARGAQLRQKMMEEISSGKLPSGYRPMWIRHSARRVSGFLSELAVEFNDVHGADQASVMDLLDILATTVHILKAAQKEIEQAIPAQVAGEPQKFQA
jgi:hypothetical protein